MADNRKRVASATLESSKPKLKKPALSRPAVVGTKASLARAKAVNAQLTATNTPKSPVSRKKKVEEPKTLARSYKTTAQGLKERPAWDLRGKVTDMTNLYKLNLQRLEELRKFKRELEITKDEKASEEKEVLQRAAALRTKLQEMERQHTIDIEDLHARLRVESQTIEDNILNYSRKLTAIEIDVSDSRRRLDKELAQLDQMRQENQALRDLMEDMSNRFNKVETEKRSLNNDTKELEKAIEIKNKEIQNKRKEIAVVDKSVQDARTKLADADKDRERLKTKIRELELKKKSMSSSSSVTSAGKR